MPFPNTSDFTGPGDQDAWWLTRFTNTDGTQGVAVCSTNGRSFVQQLQGQLGIAADGRWGPNTASSLAQALQGSGGSATLVGGVRADQTLRQVSINSLRGAIYLLQLTGQTVGDTIPSVTEDGIAVIPGTVTPVWDVAAPLGPSGQTFPSCAIQQNAVNQAVANTAVDQSGGTGTDQSGGVSTDTSLLDLPGGVSTDTSLLGLPAGVQTGQVVQQGSSISGPLILFVVGAIVLAGVFTHDVVKGTLKSKRVPAYARVRARRQSRRRRTRR